MTSIYGRPDSVNKDFRQKDRPIQNFPDYLRYVAERSKAGFDKVHEEFHKIFDGTSWKKEKRPDSKTLIYATRPGLRDRLSGNFKKNFRWTAGSSLPKEESFLSYIPEEDCSDENEIKVSATMSASIVEKSSTVFNFDEEEPLAVEKSVKMKPPINARYSAQAKSNVMDRCGDTHKSSLRLNKGMSDQILTLNAHHTVSAPMPCNSNQYLKMDGVYTKPNNEEDYACMFKDRDYKSGDFVNVHFDYENIPNDLTEIDNKPICGPTKSSSPDYINIKSIRPVPNKRPTVASRPERTYDVPPAHIRSYLSESGNSNESNSSIETPKITRSQTNAAERSSTVYHQRVTRKPCNGHSKQTFYSRFPDCQDPSNAMYDVPPSDIRAVHSLDKEDDEDLYQVPRTVKEVKIVPEACCTNTAVQNITLVNETEFFLYNSYELAFYLNKFGFATLAKVCQEFGFDGKHFQTLTTDDLRKAPYSLKPAQVKQFVKLIYGCTQHSGNCIDKNDDDGNYDIPPGERQFLVDLKNKTCIGKERNKVTITPENCRDDIEDLYINWEAMHLTKQNDAKHTNEAVSICPLAK
ncbi:uncharacterized protein LOC127870407 [Dreissena polymorpha]|uniref:SAM domain-containing protein n=1 Tax=Dreissena polymorpha TaxID=45954 RepID=A0A9D4RKA8_DREPO|nr:uncharacterized protein LOC127870407 [Dreissena polymorpha]KAH3871499.1 hypothetical protein DPMN_034702 [Dreissena polymorpha]